MTRKSSSIGLISPAELAAEKIKVIGQNSCHSRNGSSDWSMDLKSVSLICFHQRLFPMKIVIISIVF